MKRNCLTAANGGRRPGASGVTMIELMVVVSLIAVMTALGAPSLSKLIATQRVKATTEDLHLSLLRTRSEAIKRNTSVTLNASGGGWTSGWSILDPEGGAALHTQTNPSNIAISAGSVTQVIFNGTGRLTSTAPTFVISVAGSDATRCVSVEASGRPYAKEGSSC